VQLTRQVSVLGKDRPEHREPVERRVGGEDQDEPGDDRDVDDARGEVAEHRVSELAEDRVLRVLGDVLLADGLPVEGQLLSGPLGDLDVGGAAQPDDRAEHGDRQHAHHQQRRGGVAALGLLKGRHPVGDRLDASERGAAGRERAEQKEGGRDADHLLVAGLRDQLVLRAFGLPERSAHRLENADQAHADDSDDERIHRHGEGLAGLADSTQVHGGQQDDQADGNRDFVSA
jgi:hypothetical protein